MKTSFDEKTVGVEAGGVEEVKNVTDETPAVSGTVQREAKSTFQVLTVDMKEYCFVRVLLSTG